MNLLETHPSGVCLKPSLQPSHVGFPSNITQLVFTQGPASVSRVTFPFCFIHLNILEQYSPISVFPI